MKMWLTRVLTVEFVTFKPYTYNLLEGGYTYERFISRLQSACIRKTGFIKVPTVQTQFEHDPVQASEAEGV